MTEPLCKYQLIPEPFALRALATSCQGHPGYRHPAPLPVAPGHGWPWQLDARARRTIDFHPNSHAGVLCHYPSFPEPIALRALATSCQGHPSFGATGMMSYQWHPGHPGYRHPAPLPVAPGTLTSGTLARHFMQNN